MEFPISTPPAGWRRAPAVLRRVLAGVVYDGLIHAGNLAYMAIFALFPFFITAAAIFAAIGQREERVALVASVLAAMPSGAEDMIEPAALAIVDARHGWTLWVGGLVGLWTIGSLVETLRDILRRAYGTTAKQPFWRYRLGSTGVALASVALLLVLLLSQVVLGPILLALSQALVGRHVPAVVQLLYALALGRVVPAIVLFLALYLLFVALTPGVFRAARYPKWPGAALVTLWWMAVSISLPVLLARVFTYDLTYGPLAGMMIALFFFWLVGLGMVMGAELNAALAGDVLERDPLGQADNRPREDAWPT